nr:hypothetical protein [Clostridia bacterium]
PCLHHTFCAAKTLAAALDSNAYEYKDKKSVSQNISLTCETAAGLFEYPELGAVRLFNGRWIAAVIVNDFQNRNGWHAAGGTISLLWNNEYGPVIAVGMADYTINEPFNQQQTTDTESLLSACPRIEAKLDGRLYAQHYDRSAVMTNQTDENGLFVRVEACLSDTQHNRNDSGICALDYSLTDKAFVIKGSVSPALSDRAVYILPLITDGITLDVAIGAKLPDPKTGFCPSPGFMFKEYRIRPDTDGSFEIKLY